jgi:hypothetical protein
LHFQILQVPAKGAVPVRRAVAIDEVIHERPACGVGEAGVGVEGAAVRLTALPYPTARPAITPTATSSLTRSKSLALE